MTKHAKEIMNFDRQGNPIGFSNDSKLQQLIEKILDEIAWKTIGTLNATTKKWAVAPLSFFA